MSILSLLLLFCHVSSMGQEVEIERVWSSQLDSGEVNLITPQILEIEQAKLIDIYNNMPSFGIYHDNYFTTGVPTNGKVDKNSADAKFQISIRQRLSKKLGFLNTSLMLTYTQKSFWDIYKFSAPFSENNYNPGLIFAKPITDKSNRVFGFGALSFEHESNGRDSIFSRSWNFMTLSGVYLYNYNFYIQAKVWAGLVSEDNEDLLNYRGYGLLAMNYRSSNSRLWVSAIINPRDRFRSYNTTLEVNIKPTKTSNQYLFFQWYNGYAENLAEYDSYSSMVRVGICMKPLMRNFY